MAAWINVMQTSDVLVLEYSLIDLCKKKIIQIQKKSLLMKLVPLILLSTDNQLILIMMNSSEDVKTPLAKAIF